MLSKKTIEGVRAMAPSGLPITLDFSPSASAGSVADQSKASPKELGESFADHLNHALSSIETSNDTKFAKGSPAAKSDSAPTLPATARGTHAQRPASSSKASSPIGRGSTDDAGSSVSTSATVADNDVSWLAQMLPDVFANAKNPDLTGLSRATDPPTPTGKPSSEEQQQTTAPEAQDDKTAASPAASIPSAKEHPSADVLQSHSEDPSVVGEPSTPATPPTASPDVPAPQSGQPAARTSTDTKSGIADASSNVATRQGDPSVQKAVAVMESMDLMATSASANALPPSGRTAPSTVALNNSDTSKVISTKAADGSSSQNAGKDSGAQAGGTTQAQVAKNDAPQPSKSAGSGNSDGSKDGNAQSAAAHPSGSTESTGSASVANGATTANVTAQAVASAVQPALSQPPVIASSSAHPASGTQSGTVQTTVGEKVAAAMETPVNASTGLVNTASLSVAQGRTEMRVALQTDSLGTLQLHAVMEGTQIGASIATVNHEARTLLANDLPALQQVLADQNLRVERLTITHSPMTSGSGSGDSRGSQSGDSSRPRDQAGRWFFDTSTPSTAPAAPEAPSGRLSVRA
jgi:flagellar hook-length control protein FliK